ncbi:unnamed protein product [Paramecium sonneborni]|uniref:Uncharacterized protein n=1 Tax=Paramecium sonneborni TaxID=65129 RepID=A0A8S1MUL2_9CILI|nr:unnamed protein product [Paramecium sonneborni]
MILKSDKENDSLKNKTLSNITRLFKNQMSLNNQDHQTSLFEDYKLEAQIGKRFILLKLEFLDISRVDNVLIQKYIEKNKLDLKIINRIHREFAILKQLEYLTMVKLHNSLEDEK